MPRHGVRASARGTGRAAANERPQRALPAVCSGRWRRAHAQYLSRIRNDEPVEPDPATLGLFEVLKPLGEVIESVPLQTCRLDDISEIQHLDFLKIDIQGGELAGSKEGKRSWAEAVAIETEISFATLYKNQPSLGEVDRTAQPGIPSALLRRDQALADRPAAIETIPPGLDHSWRPISSTCATSSRGLDERRATEATGADRHYCYRRFDLAVRRVMPLEQRQALEAGTQQRYLGLSAQPPKPA